MTANESFFAVYFIVVHLYAFLLINTNDFCSLKLIAVHMHLPLVASSFRQNLACAYAETCVCYTSAHRKPYFVQHRSRCSSFFLESIPGVVSSLDICLERSFVCLNLQRESLTYPVRGTGAIMRAFCFCRVASSFGFGNSLAAASSIESNNLVIANKLRGSPPF